MDMGAQRRPGIERVSPATLDPGTQHSPGLGGHGAHKVTPQKAPTLPQQSSWAVSSSRGLAHWKKGHGHLSPLLTSPAVYRDVPGKAETKALPSRPPQLARGYPHPKESRRESADIQEGSKETCSPLCQARNLRGGDTSQARQDLLCTMPHAMSWPTASQRMGFLPSNFRVTCSANLPHGQGLGLGTSQAERSGEVWGLRVPVPWLPPTTSSSLISRGISGNTKLQA